MRLRLPETLVLCSLLLFAAIPSRADWIATGVPVYEPGSEGGAPYLAPDGQGGAFITWEDIRHPSLTDSDVYLQRMTASGTISPGWPGTGLPVCGLSNTQYPVRISPDGFGGVLVAWLDFRSTSPDTAEDPYVQRILADGSVAPGWTDNGVAASHGLDYQDNVAMSPDGEGGAFLAWTDWRDYGTNRVDIYAQHITAAGTIAVGWPADGLPVCVDPSTQAGPWILSDNAGGAIVAWSDLRGGVRATYAQHLLANGSIAPGWLANGLPMAPGRVLNQALRDESGGFYLVTAIVHPTYPGFSDIYAQRMNSDGAPAAGWTASGLRVCGADNYRSGAFVTPDGFGGVLLSWYDYRSSGPGIFAARVSPGGSLVPGWTTDGTLVSEPNSPYSQYQNGQSVAPDGAGGVYVLWKRSDVATSAFIQHLSPSGVVAPGWLPYGARVAPSADQGDASLTSDGDGGAIVSWSEHCCGRTGLYAQRFALDGPVAVELSLASAVVREGRVTLDWFNAGTPVGSAILSRRTESSAWVILTSINSDGTGHLRYEDPSVTPGTRYAYRLNYVESGVERFTAETWVDVPALALALGGLRPNPATGPLTVSFALSTSDPALLEVLDVSGRRLMQREVGSMGAGTHVVRLDEGRSLASGIYWLRLRQGARVLLARGAVMR
jgi:hypothetical protein